ncbi:MAG: tripartite tricarboxylate transporter substrate binding protein [Xanthobacteraceae bacterium]
MISAPRVTACLLVALSLPGLNESVARAEDYPTHPVRIIVGYGAGAQADTPARLLAQKFSAVLGQQFVVENKPGAGGNLAAAYVAHARGDGYTLLMATSAQSVYAATTLDPAYDVKKDFAPIIRVASLSLVLVAHPSLGVSNLHELIALAKQKPGQIFYATSGVGTVTHMAGELLNMMAGIKLVDVPYPGSAQALTDALSGRVPLLMTPVSSVVQQIANGDLKALAVAGAQRANIAHKIPTMAEAGLPGYDLDLWFGLLAPAGTPAATVGKLAHIADMALKTDDIGGAMQRIGIDPVGGSPEDFARYIDAEVKKATDVAVAANLRK